MPTYRGSCHCQAVKFEATTDLETVAECNCSICYKKGAILHRVKPDRFRILEGEDALAEYRFNTGVARHFFCRRCGIHPFGRPRLAPDEWVVNVRCLDDVDLATLEARRIQFDGRSR
jgi:hypothetical protein